jgi:rod shape-determining protein MreD
MLKQIKVFFKTIHISSLPTLTVLCSILLGVFPYKIDNFSLFIPLLTPIAIYFWTIYQPQYLSFTAVFFLGLFKDILEHNTLGMSSTHLLVFQAMVESQRKYIMARSFVVIWTGFIFFLSIILLIPEIFGYFRMDAATHKYTVILGQYLITILIYVPAHWLLNKINDLMP